MIAMPKYADVRARLVQNCWCTARNQLTVCRRGPPRRTPLMNIQGRSTHSSIWLQQNSASDRPHGAFDQCYCRQHTDRFEKQSTGAVTAASGSGRNYPFPPHTLFFIFWGGRGPFPPPPGPPLLAAPHIHDSAVAEARQRFERSGVGNPRGGAAIGAGNGGLTQSASCCTLYASV